MQHSYLKSSIGNSIQKSIQTSGTKPIKSTLHIFLFAVLSFQLVFSSGCGGDKKEVTTIEKASPEKVAEKSSKEAAEAKSSEGENIEHAQVKTEKPLPKTLKIDLGDGVKLELVKIKSGKFTMGQIGDQENEQPLREVTLTRDFFIGKYEVTQEEYKKIVGNNPSKHTPANSYQNTGKQPVESVARAEAAIFCNELSKRLGLTPCYRIIPGETLSETLVFWEDDGNGFRLPTEAEWEYCCRGGTPSKYFWGHEVNDQIANEYMWCKENACKSGWKEPHAEMSGTQPVGAKSANPWGLHDVYGNVAEWCWDTYTDDYTDLDGDPLIDPRGGSSSGYGVIRGGAYFFDAQHCYSARRLSCSPYDKDYSDHVGFRVVKEIWRSTLLPKKKSNMKAKEAGKDESGQTSQEKPLDLELGDGIQIGFVKIAPGKFSMGRKDGAADTKYVREVTIASGLLCGKHEVTQSQFEKIMGYNPSFYKSAEAKDLPVESVSWYEAVSFCNKLSQKAGLTPCYTDQNGDYDISQNDYIDCDWNASGYRLPTEAEWEYCCRAGTTTTYYWGDSDEKADLNKHTCWWGNSGYKMFQKGSGKPAKAGAFAPNPWGLYDMQGNVWEWCWDWYGHNYYSAGSDKDPKGPAGGNNRIVRGGGYDSGPQSLNPAYRYRQSFENYKDYSTGFRIVTSNDL
ncbi:MAG: serine/threonine protein kinase [uncultured bacterium]|nr:MAG: serine/threonine protein kinase [uncultured bacterium]